MGTCCAKGKPNQKFIDEQHHFPPKTGINSIEQHHKLSEIKEKADHFSDSRSSTFYQHAAQNELVTGLKRKDDFLEKYNIECECRRKMKIFNQPHIPNLIQLVQRENQSMRLMKFYPDMLDVGKNLVLQSKLDHIGIPKIQEYYELDSIYENPSAITIYNNINGCQLIPRLCRLKTIGEDVICFIITQLLELIGYLHSKNIILRHLNLDSIFCRNQTNFEIELQDLEYAMEINVGLIDSHVYGDLQLPNNFYKAPEISQQKKYGTKADIYCCGLIALQLFLGGVANIYDFGQYMKNNQYFNQDLFCQAQEFKDLPIEVQNFIRYLVQEDPEKRPDYQQALEHEYLQNYRENMVAEKCECQIKLQFEKSVDEILLMDSIYNYALQSINCFKERKKIRYILGTIYKQKSGKIPKNSIKTCLLIYDLTYTHTEVQEILHLMVRLFDEEELIEYNTFIKYFNHIILSFQWNHIQKYLDKYVQSESDADKFIEILSKQTDPQLRRINLTYIANYKKTCKNKADQDKVKLNKEKFMNVLRIIYNDSF